MKRIKTSDIKKGFRFDFRILNDYSGIYEVVCFRKDLSEIYCYKPVGRESTIERDGNLAKFDERIINNPEFLKYKERKK